MPPRHAVLLSLIVLLGMSHRAAGAEPDALADEDLLRSAHIATDGPGLLAFFRNRTLDDEARSHIQTLIGQMGSESYALREQASAELTSLGIVAAAPLREATRHADLEIRRRARLALLDIERDWDTAVIGAAARLLGRRKPPETAEVLLAYLPSAEDSSIADEVCLVLASVAVHDGVVEPVLVRALTDRMAVKRGAAGAALCRAGCRKQFAAVRRLLHDSDPLVRQRVAVALVEAREKDAVPVLIALLTDLPQDEAARVEELLIQLAGDQTPPGELDGSDAARREYRQAWEDWWTSHGAGLELAKVEGLGRSLGHTLIAQLDLPRTNGRVLEMDVRGRKRWEIEGLQYPIDAQTIDAQRVLVAEYTVRKVTERNHKGQVLWEKQVNGVLLGARRLANGNTFIVTRNRVFEVNRKGDEVWSLNHQRTGLVADACPLPNGEVGVISTNGEFQRLDRAGKVLKSFRVGGIVLSIGTHIQVLPNGHVLVPFYSGNRVVECDSQGKQVWTMAANRPTCVQRLPNGHTLISSRLSDLILEVDRKGQEVWSHRCEGRPMRVQRR